MVLVIDVAFVAFLDHVENAGFNPAGLLIASNTERHSVSIRYLGSAQAGFMSKNEDDADSATYHRKRPRAVMSVPSVRRDVVR